MEKRGQGGKYSSMAIVAFVFSLIFFIPIFPLVGIVLGIIAIVKISKDRSLKGKGLAIAAIIVGALITILQILLIIFFVIAAQNLASTINSVGKGTPQEQMNNCLDSKSGLSKDLCIVMTVSLNANQTNLFDPEICNNNVGNADMKNLCNAVLKKDKSYCNNINQFDARSKCVEAIDKLQSNTVTQ